MLSTKFVALDFLSRTTPIFLQQGSVLKEGKPNHSLIFSPHEIMGSKFNVIDHHLMWLKILPRGPTS